MWDYFLPPLSLHLLHLAFHESQAVPVFTTLLLLLLLLLLYFYPVPKTLYVHSPTPLRMCSSITKLFSELVQLFVRLFSHLPKSTAPAASNKNINISILYSCISPHALFIRICITTLWDNSWTGATRPHRLYSTGNLVTQRLGTAGWYIIGPVLKTWFVSHIWLYTKCLIN